MQYRTVLKLTDKVQSHSSFHPSVESGVPVPVLGHITYSECHNVPVRSGEVYNNHRLVYSSSLFLCDFP